MTDGLNTDRDGEKHKYDSIILTATWLTPQYAKQVVSKFRLRTYVKSLRGHRYWYILLFFITNKLYVCSC